MTSRDIHGRQSAYFFRRHPLYSSQVKFMKNLVVAAAAAALLVSGMSAQQAPAPKMVAAHPSAPRPTDATKAGAPPLAVDAQNQLVGQYCATCHSERGKAGGLVLAGFDA